MNKNCWLDLELTLKDFETFLMLSAQGMLDSVWKWLMNSSEIIDQKCKQL